jgi:hypothetical protein
VGWWKKRLCCAVLTLPEWVGQIKVDGEELDLWRNQRF